MKIDLETSHLIGQTYSIGSKNTKQAALPTRRVFSTLVNNKRSVILVLL